MTESICSVVERFAPSPTGRLHLGHAYSALQAFSAAKQDNGQFLLRIDDLDPVRTREEFISGILEDMQWLGLPWDGDIYYSSQHKDKHLVALEKLKALGVVYPCECSRKDIQLAVSAPQENADRPVLYPGTCREKKDFSKNKQLATRLNMARVIEVLGGPLAVAELTFTELGEGPNKETEKVPIDADRLITEVGDVVLHRKDGSIAYHLAVVIDDEIQGVKCVTRARDLFESTSIHRILQALLGLRVPDYRHHRIIRDDAGRRLAKRDGDRSIASFRDAGLIPRDIWDILDI